MGGVLESFGVIGVVIGLGFVLAHTGVVGEETQQMLSRLVFFSAGPALMFSVLSDVDAVAVLSSNMVVAASCFVVAGLIAAVLARYAWRLPLGDGVLAVLCSAWVNSGNLGIPIAIYALGDASAVAGVSLFQMVLVQPIALALLDQAGSVRRMPVARIVTQPFRNPMTVGSLLGLAVAAVGWKPPSIVQAPIDLVAGIAVPAMLIAYGVSLRLGPRPGSGAPAGRVVAVTTLKLVVQPLVAYLVGAYVLGLEGSTLLAVTVVAALPTAQIMFVYATRYGVSTLLVRDTTLTTTVLSVPAMLTIVALLA